MAANMALKLRIAGRPQNAPVTEPHAILLAIQIWSPLFTQSVFGHFTYQNDNSARSSALFPIDKAVTAQAGLCEMQTHRVCRSVCTTTETSSRWYAFFLEENYMNWSGVNHALCCPSSRILQGYADSTAPTVIALQFNGAMRNDSACYAAFAFPCARTL